MHHFSKAMQYRQATCDVSVNAEVILTKSCVVEGFVGQSPNSDSNVPKIFLIFFPKSYPHLYAMELVIPKK